MAYTVSHVVNTVWGNLRVNTMKITADAATQTVESKCGVIYGMSLGPSSMATSAISVFENVDASGTAANGSVGISAAAANDVFFLTVFGT